MTDLGTVTDARTQSIAEAKRGRVVRRIGIAMMLLFVLAGVFGFFGQRQGSASRSASGYSISVSYPRVTRGGLAANWELQVQRDDGRPLPAGMEIRSTAGYFSIFDENGFDPEPAATWSDDRTVTWSFEPPSGSDTLVVSFDARMQPNSRGWFDGETSLVIEGEVVTSVSYRTWAVP